LTHTSQFSVRSFYTLESDVSINDFLLTHTSQFSVRSFYTLESDGSSRLCALELKQTKQQQPAYFRALSSLIRKDSWLELAWIHVQPRASRSDHCHNHHVKGHLGLLLLAQLGFHHQFLGQALRQNRSNHLTIPQYAYLDRNSDLEVATLSR